MADLRSELLTLLSNPAGHKDPAIRTEFASKLDAYSKSEGCDPNDVLFAIGSTVFGADVAPPSKKAKTNGGNGEEDFPIVDFDYMKAFMKEVFISYGVTPENAETCSDVLIESDKRGIDSHGLGRLKPIYCDRMDQGILFPDKPITVLKESDCTALVGKFVVFSNVMCLNEFNSLTTFFISEQMETWDLDFTLGPTVCKWQLIRQRSTELVLWPARTLR